VDDIIAPQIEVTREGSIKLPDGPGMGYTVDAGNVARYRIRLEKIKL
jgi:L-alanine-DL-glutamate epimerase-like enolase superfamily enzyme